MSPCTNPFIVLFTSSIKPTNLSPYYSIYQVDCLYRSVELFTYKTISLLVCMTIYLFIHLPNHSICLSIWLLTLMLVYLLSTTLCLSLLPYAVFYGFQYLAFIYLLASSVGLLLRVYFMLCHVLYIFERGTHNYCSSYGAISVSPKVTQQLASTTTSFLVLVRKNNVPHTSGLISPGRISIKKIPSFTELLNPWLPLACTGHLRNV